MYVRCVCVSVQCSATSLGLSNMSSKDFLYYIITEKPGYPGHIKAGHICYIPESKYKLASKRSTSSSKLPVTPLGSASGVHYDIDINCMRTLSAEEAELLQALPEDTDRLKWYREKHALRTALDLTVGTDVVVEEEGEELGGIIRYIGRMKEPTYSDPLPGRFFGIELQV